MSEAGQLEKFYTGYFMTPFLLYRLGTRRWGLIVRSSQLSVNGTAPSAESALGRAAGNEWHILPLMGTTFTKTRWTT